MLVLAVCELLFPVHQSVLPWPRDTEPGSVNHDIVYKGKNKKQSKRFYKTGDPKWDGSDLAQRMENTQKGKTHFITNIVPSLQIDGL